MAGKPQPICVRDVCTLDVSLDHGNLSSETCDPCLDEVSSAAAHIPVTIPDSHGGAPIELNLLVPAGPKIKFDDLHHITWYGPKNHGGFGSSEYNIDVYQDPAVAVGDALNQAFPGNSLVVTSYRGKEESAISRDTKPLDGTAAKGNGGQSLDLTKGLVYLLGGKELLVDGVIEPVYVQSVVINPAIYGDETDFVGLDKSLSSVIASPGEKAAHPLSGIRHQNHFAHITALYYRTVWTDPATGKREATPIPEPQSYSNMLGLYHNLIAIVGALKVFRHDLVAFLPEAAAAFDPAVEFVLVHRNAITPPGEKKRTDIYMTLRLSGFKDEEDAQAFLELLRPYMEGEDAPLYFKPSGGKDLSVHTEPWNRLRRVRKDGRDALRLDPIVDGKYLPDSVRPDETDNGESKGKKAEGQTGRKGKTREVRHTKRLKGHRKEKPHHSKRLARK